MFSVFNNNVFSVFVLRASLLAFTLPNFNYIDAKSGKYIIGSRDVFMKMLESVLKK